MARYIDAHKLAKVYMGKGKDKLRLATVINELELAPTADVQEVRHGKWIGYPSITISKRRRTIYSITYQCSCCGKSNGRAKSPYCKNCGAKMNKE